jgi:hypothetical protein
MHEPWGCEQNRWSNQTTTVKEAHSFREISPVSRAILKRKGFATAFSYFPAQK